MRPYSEADWQAENTALQQGVDPQPCPKCRCTGFYSTRCAEPLAGKTEPRHYRACKFCGFWQDVDAAAVPHRATAHGCAGWPKPAGASWVWWVAPTDTTYACPNKTCGQQVIVAQTLVPIPADDPQHPWWSVPQHCSQAYYLAFWSAEGLDTSPFGVL